jgi:hypothetical protein
MLEKSFDHPPKEINLKRSKKRKKNLKNKRKIDQILMKKNQRREKRKGEKVNKIECFFRKIENYFERF